MKAREEGRRQFDLHYDAIIDHYEFRGTHMADDKNNKMLTEFVPILLNGSEIRYC